MLVERRALDELTLDPFNARKHGERNLGVIARSLSEFGQRRPVVIRADGTVLAGNGLVLAASELGWSEVDVTVVPEDWSEEQARAYAIADNRAGDLSEWNDEALLEALDALDGTALLEAAGFREEDLDDLRAEIEEDVPGEKGTGKTTQGERYSPSLADYAERYASKTTRFIALDYPNEVYLWVTDKLAAARTEFGLDSNAATVLRILEEWTGEEGPEWT